MNGKLLIAKLLLLAGSALVAFPAAAVSFDSNWFATRISPAPGTNFAIGPLHATHFCYLSKVGLQDIGGANNDAHCRVYRGNNVWVLEAVTSGTGATTGARCEAICYNN